MLYKIKHERFLITIISFIVVFFLFAPVLIAENLNFEKYAAETGCDSVVFSSRRSKCTSLYRVQKIACYTSSFKCNLDKANDTRTNIIVAIAREKEAIANIKGDKGKSHATDMKKLVAKHYRALTALKTGAKAKKNIANKCANARKHVQNHFKETLALTIGAGESAANNRKKIVDQFNKARKLRDETKKKRDAAQRGKDNSLKSSTRKDWGNARDKLKEIGSKLQEFDDENGSKVIYYSRQLEAYYLSERNEHARAIKEVKGVIRNCARLQRINHPNYKL